MPRSRTLYLPLVLVVITLGLASRRYRGALPTLIGTYAGDTLWAMMVFLLIAAIHRRADTRVLVVAALLFAFGIESSQLYHASWIDALRGTRLGALVLGHSFLWSDLLCYAVGIAIAAVVDSFLRSPAHGP